MPNIQVPVALLVLAGVLVAQEDVPLLKREWVTLSAYDEHNSRAAFAACDENGDDRLDIKEAVRSLTGMGSAESPIGFREVDENRDGYLSWPEFDGRYRTVIGRKSPFLFLPVRPYSLRKIGGESTEKQKTRAAVQMLTAMANTDDDPDISKAEFKRLVETLKQPPRTVDYFDILDQDGSGGLSADELEPLVVKIRHLIQLVAGTAGAAADKTNETQLTARLAKMNPALRRWGKVVFKAADKNGDGVLDEEELPTRKKTPKK